MDTNAWRKIYVLVVIEPQYVTGSFLAALLTAIVESFYSV